VTAIKEKKNNYFFEYDYLAPDTANEMLKALETLQYFTGKAFYKKFHAQNNFSEKQCIVQGAILLNAKAPVVNQLEIEAEGFENAKRKNHSH